MDDLKALSDAIYARDLDGTGSMHICWDEDPGAVAFVPFSSVEAAIEAARAEERERCAKIVEAEGRKARKYPEEAIAETYCDDAAAAIRAGGE